MDTLSKKFGRRVRKLRTLQDLSQEEFADIAKIDRGHMGHIERGTKSASLTKVEQIAKALDTPEANLFLDI